MLGVSGSNGLSNGNSSGLTPTDRIANWGATLTRTINNHWVIRPRVVDLDDSAERQRAAAAMRFQHAQASALGDGPPQGQPRSGAAAAAPPAEPFKRETPKVGRNEPCPCGSGKKFKQCHGKLG